MDDLISIQVVIDTIHKTIYQFFDVCDDDEEVPISDKDKLLLTVNKAICNNLKALEQEPEQLVNESGDLVKDLVKDTISRQAVQDYTAKYLSQYLHDDVREAVEEIDEYIGELPPVTPQYTDAGIQKMQDLEQAKIEKAYKSGKAEQSKTDVLDRISAEITNINLIDTDGHCNNWYREPQAIINDALRIIDKYKAESEDVKNERNI